MSCDNLNQDNEYDGYLYKCGGIPKAPAGYSFDFERPASISDEQERIIKEKSMKFIRNFFKKGLEENIL